jgi:hypothetical protein
MRAHCPQPVRENASHESEWADGQTAEVWSSCMVQQSRRASWLIVSMCSSMLHTL